MKTIISSLGLAALSIFAGVTFISCSDDDTITSTVTPTDKIKLKISKITVG